MGVVFGTAVCLSDRVLLANMSLVQEFGSKVWPRNYTFPRVGVSDVFFVVLEHASEGTTNIEGRYSNCWRRFLVADKAEGFRTRGRTGPGILKCVGTRRVGHLLKVSSN